MHLAGDQRMLLVLLPPLLSSKKHTMLIEPLHNGYYLSTTLFGSSECSQEVGGQYYT